LRPAFAGLNYILTLPHKTEIESALV